MNTYRDLHFGDQFQARQVSVYQNSLVLNFLV